jgi:hypothetical protein
MNNGATVHTLAQCSCEHAAEDHALPDPTLANPQPTVSCARCNHADRVRAKSRNELDNYARTLIDQSERFVAQLSVDLSDVPRVIQDADPQVNAATAYYRLTIAQQRADPAEWYQAENVDSRPVKEIMDRLGDVAEEFDAR